jgi:hypothetical protein
MGNRAFAAGNEPAEAGAAAADDLTSAPSATGATAAVVAAVRMKSRRVNGKFMASNNSCVQQQQD